MTDRQFQVGDRVCTVGESWAGREGQEGVITGRTTRGNFKVVLDSDIDRDNAWIVTQNFGVRPAEAANVAEGATKVVPLHPGSWDDNGEAVDTGDWRKVTMEELNKESDTPVTVYSSQSNAEFATRVKGILDGVAETLITKNAQYGDAALNPRRIFSKLPPVEGIKLRLDDKLSRIELGDGTGDEDAVLDAMGYLVLLKIAESEDD